MEMRKFWLNVFLGKANYKDIEKLGFSLAQINQLVSTVVNRSWLAQIILNNFEINRVIDLRTGATIYYY